jgi:Rrf2 family cysteine metabolism transcriptional repressor
MPVSAKGEYAARALLHLASAFEEGAPVRTADIATEQSIPKKYLEQILLVFKQKGLVRSKPGLNGGYFLAKPPSEITMAEVVRAVDGPLAPVRCVSQTAYAPCTCRVEATCALRTVWQEARDAMVGVLEKITLEEITIRARALQEVCALSYDI